MGAPFTLMSLSVGDRVGRYEILAPIGAGSMGEVYRARDSQLDRSVAVKILTSSRHATTLQLERFNTELAVSIAQALEARLSHTFTPKLNELVSGLDQLRGQQTSFSEDVLRTVTDQVSKAMTSSLEAVGMRVRFAMPPRLSTAIGACAANRT